MTFFTGVGALALVAIAGGVGFIAYRLHTASTPAVTPAQTTAEPDVDRVIVGPPMVVSATGQVDTAGDFLKHYSRGEYSWDDVGFELYRRIEADEVLVGYFTDEALQRLPRHTAHALKIVTVDGLREKTLIWLTEVHRDVRNRDGQPITDEVFDRLFGVLASVLSDMGVPRDGLGSLADLRDALRVAIVAE